MGATHLADYTFWRSGENASEAMKEYGENGLTNLLEREFNANFMVNFHRVPTIFLYQYKLFTYP